MFIALWAVFVFVLLKSLFAVLGWYSRDNTDALYRRRLDVVWDELNRGSLFQFSQRMLKRLANRIRDTFWHPATRRWRIVLVLGGLSAVALLTAGELFELLVAHLPAHVYPLEFELRPDREYAFGKGLVVLFFPGWAPIGRAEPIVTNLALLASGLAFSLLSFWISWRLLYHASTSRSMLTILVHLVIIVAVVIASMVFVNAVYAATYLLVTHWLAPLPVDSSDVSTLQFLWFNIVKFLAILWSALQGRVADDLTLFEVRGVVVALSLVFPLLIYAVICVVAFVARLMPQAAKRFTAHCIYLISTDEKPVLSQLGTAVGAVGALLAGLLSALKGP